MNYQKIYQDFITSRRAREADIVGYSEKHHIVPKALGGVTRRDIGAIATGVQKIAKGLQLC